MKNNEFFNNMRNTVKNNEVTRGENQAFWAWRECIDAGLDCPFLKDSIWEEHVSNFLATIEAAGFTKFAYKSGSTMTFENIIDFMKAGWAITGRIEIDDSDFYAQRTIDAVIFERRN
ncbi:MAG: hypothetical protein IJ859_01700 [Synergistaceae bacterium]|nr:hypothetical protein [Synergistaceae bacterium]